MAEDFLNMSDEEMSNMSVPEITQEAPAGSTTDTDTNVPGDTTNAPEGDTDASTDTLEDTDADTTKDNEVGSVDTSNEVATDDNSKVSTSKTVADTEAADETGKSTEAAAAIDYKAAYEKVLAPFRANGKDIKVDSIDDAVSLMMMGANYNKKMAGLKPVMKLVKMLENNGLMDESQLSYLIDLSKKNPDAIKKLVKDSGINPLEIDTENTTDYRPNTYTVNDNEVELDTVLDEIKDSPTFKDTIDIVSNKMDASSKKVLLATPSLIKTINEHVASGIYAKITTVIESERMLGRLTGLSDLEAYKQVGDAIHARGGFGKPNTQPKANVLNTTSVSQQPDPKLKDRKKAASASRTITPAGGTPEFNPLSLSDEEFEKLSLSKFK